MFGFSDKIRFKQVAQPEDCESLIQNPDVSQEPSQLRPKTQSSSLCTSLLWFIAFPIIALLGVLVGSYFPMRPDTICIKRTSQYSPLLEDIPITFDTIQFNGSLFKPNAFRKIAGPEVDAAWESLGVDYRAAIVPANLAPRAGLLPSQVQVNSKYGGGFPANVEGLHHLHCLNLVRQSIYYNYEYYHARGQGAFKNNDEILHFHVSHCLDILRQQLMCTVDIGVLGKVWWNKETPTPYPDFNTEHKCRNFDDVRQWAFEHQGPLEVPGDYLEPPDLEGVYAEVP